MTIKQQLSMIKSTQRRSDIELLRIVSMAAVVIVHLNFASIGVPKIESFSQLFEARNLWQVSVQSIAIIGVNCFALISGFFGIRARWKSGLNFLVQCLIYSLGLFILADASLGFIAPFADYVKACQILSCNDLWYVPAYFGLYLLAPFLNAGCEALSRRQFSALLVLFVVFNLWCGWWYGGSFNPTGYTLVQLILLYLIGRYISKYPLPIAGTQKCRIIAFVIFLAASMASVVLYPFMPPAKLFAYNSPIVMIQSVALLFAFMNPKFSSRSVNFVAQSSFAVYLIHKNPFVFGGVLKPLAKQAWQQYDVFGYTLWMIVASIAVFVISVAADTLRRYLWQKITNLPSYVKSLSSYFWKRKSL